MTETDTIFLPTQHVRLAMRAFSGSPDLLASILKGSGLTPEGLQTEQFSFPISAIWAITDNLSKMFGPGWFLSLPILWSIDAQSELGMAIRLARNFEEALEVIVRFTHVRWPLGRAIGARSRDFYALTIKPQLQISQANFQMASVVAALNFQTTARSMVGDDASRISYFFATEEPPYKDAVSELFLGRCTWGNRDFVIRIPADLLGINSPTCDTVGFNHLIGSLESRHLHHGMNQSMTDKVRSILRSIKVGRIDAATVASRIGVTTRTLERKLSEDQATFRELHEESMKERFLEILRNAPSGAKFIAEQLGYNDAASLQRACRRWFGKPFSTVRRELGDPALASAE